MFFNGRLFHVQIPARIFGSRFSFIYSTGHEAPCPIKEQSCLKFLFIKEQIFPPTDGLRQSFEPDLALIN
jgi:hypothetical protein